MEIELFATLQTIFVDPKFADDSLHKTQGSQLLFSFSLLFKNYFSCNIFFFSIYCAYLFLWDRSFVKFKVDCMGWQNFAFAM